MKKTSLYDEFKDFIIKFYLFFLIGIFPFVYNNNFIDITRAKKIVFQYASVPFIVIGIVICIYEYIKNKNIRIDIIDYIAVFFSVMVIISSLLSVHRNEAIWGTSGRQLGGVYLVICAMVTVVVSKLHVDYKFFMKILFVSNTMEFVLVVCNFLGVDILGMYTNLVESEHNYFLGTLGNINVSAEYVSLITALTMVLGYVEQDKKKRKLISIFVMLGMFTCLCTRSDSWLIPIGITFIILAFYGMDKKEKLFVIIQYLVCLIIASAVMFSLKIIENNTAWDNLWIKDIDTRNLQSILISKEVILIEIVVVAVLIQLIKGGLFSVIQKYGRKILTSVLIVLLMCGLLIVFPLEDSFGSHRGYIWKRSIFTYMDFPLLNKLFGCGPNCFYYALEDKYGIEMVEVCGGIFIDAHNEIIQFLVVIGLLGVMGYVGMFVATLVKVIKNRKLPEGMVGIVFMIAYIMQGLVNNPTTFTTPIIFAFMGIINGQLSGKK